MEKISDKAQLKALIAKTSLTVIPGTQVLHNVEEAAESAERIGYPVMLKACAGGGGRGIRMVQGPEDLQEAWKQAVCEAETAFADGSMYLEKYIFPARHVEL